MTDADGPRPPDATPPSGAASTAPAPIPAGSWLGLTALIVGLVALVGAIIPVLNYVSGLLAVAGIVLGIIALVRKDPRRRRAIVATVISAIALVLSIVLAIVYTAGFVRFVRDSAENGSYGIFGPGNTVEVLYEVVGDGDSAAVKYTDLVDGRPTAQIEDSVSLPFSVTFVLPGDDSVDLDDFGVLAQSGAGEISCRITVDGVVVDEETSSSAGEPIACNAG